LIFFLGKNCFSSRRKTRSRKS